MNVHSKCLKNVPDLCGLVQAEHCGRIYLRVHKEPFNKLIVEICEARNLTPINMNRSSDPYVESKLIPVTVKSGEKHRLSNFKTRTSRSTLNPQWYESFTL